MVYQGIDYSKVDAFYFFLRRVKWKIFGNLTFEDKKKRGNLRTAHVDRQNDFGVLLERAAFKLQLQLNDFYYFLRHEKNRLDKGWHLHFCLADYGPIQKLDSYEVADELGAIWRRDFLGPSGKNGTTSIHPYDEEKYKERGVSYFCKRKGMDRGGDGFFNDIIISDNLKILAEDTSFLCS